MVQYIHHSGEEFSTGLACGVQFPYVVDLLYPHIFPVYWCNISEITQCPGHPRLTRSEISVAFRVINPSIAQIIGYHRLNGTNLRLINDTISR